jgi:hypothetical protein
MTQSCSHPAPSCEHTAPSCDHANWLTTTAGADVSVHGLDIGIGAGLDLHLGDVVGLGAVAVVDIGGCHS